MSDEKTVMDEVNAALGDAIAPESEPLESASEDENVDSTDADGDATDSEGDAAESDSDEPADGESDPEGEPEPEKGPNGERERNPDGTWKKKEVEPPKKDPINDPIPENLKKDTAERIRTLIDTAKTVTQERDKFKQDFDYLIQGVQATGTTPQQYGETLSWLAMFNSNDPKQQEKALELVENVADRLATLLGKERAASDPLKAHADLVEAVRTGKLSPEYAKEIARTRNGQQFRTELTTQQTQQQQDEQNAATELHNARAGLTQLENTLQGTDPEYAAKKSTLVTALRPIFARGQDGNWIVPPSQWVQRFQEAYKNLRLPGGAPAKAQTPKNQPLRAGKQPAGGQTKAPSSMLEAISGALQGMNK